MRLFDGKPVDDPPYTMDSEIDRTGLMSDEDIVELTEARIQAEQDDWVPPRDPERPRSTLD